MSEQEEGNYPLTSKKNSNDQLLSANGDHPSTPEDIIQKQ